MAKVRKEEKEFNIAKTYFAVRSNSLGLSESEITSDLGFKRKTVNNYLRYLAKSMLIYKDGRYWFCSGDTPVEFSTMNFIRVL